MLKNHVIDADDFAALQHLMPATFAGVVEIVGVKAAYELVLKYRGTSFKIGQNQRKGGRALHFCLAEIVGEEAAGRIETALAGQRELYIPKCDKALRELRNRQIRRQFDELTTQKPYPMTATLASRNLAHEYNLTGRMINEIVNTPDLLPEMEVVQQNLF